MKRTLLAISLLVASLASAQEASTLFFLENAVNRHNLNPAFQPVSGGYLNLPVLGNSNIYVGNNCLTMSDLYYKRDGQLITALRDPQSQQKLLNTLHSTVYGEAEVEINLLGFGWRHKDNGYVYIDVNQRMYLGASFPRDFYKLIVGGMENLDGGNNHFDFSKLGQRVLTYTEIGGGYSYRINDKWTVGGKLKFLLGEANLSMGVDSYTLDASATEWKTAGSGKLDMSANVNLDLLPATLTYKTLSGYSWKEILDEFVSTSVAKPTGYGGAIDLGFEYRPLPNLHLSLAVNDLGFITWTKNNTYDVCFDGSYTGSDYTYDDFVKEGGFVYDVQKALEGIAAHISAGGRHARTTTKMINGTLNAGFNANFVHDIFGVGVFNKMQWYGNHVYDEVTIGGNIKAGKYFDLAVSYSLVDNAKYSDIGGGISLIPYDGLNLMIAMDYIPTSYTNVRDDAGCYMPYKTKGINLSFGLSIVWGTNKKKDSDKDGVADKYDLCPLTPKGVKVDSRGCPYDTDGDGVPDYLDQCPMTPVTAYGWTDSIGCPTDVDGDGVPDYLDECNDTKPEAYGYVDAKGCDMDTDGDGVPDWRDACPGTPVEARGHVDSVGCELDTDADGVPDWRDQCPNTKPGTPVDSLGCDIDSDGDEVPDYEDECPNVPGPKENKGCPELKKEVRQLLQKAMHGIEFQSGKATIKPVSYPILDSIANTFIRNSHFFIEVQGHTDNTGSLSVNTKLSDDRAKAVRQYLIGKGVPEERIVAKGYGPTVPVADNKTKAGRQKNRRVEFNIQFEQVEVLTIRDRVSPDSVTTRQVEYEFNNQENNNQ